MVWLNPDDYKGQEYVELRLNAPKSEKIFLEFNPLKMSCEPDWNPMWEEWHCYISPLRIYNFLFGIVYPLKRAYKYTLQATGKNFIIKYINWYLLRRAKRWIKNGKDYMKKQ